MLFRSPSGWRPPVSMTDAVNGKGIDDLIQNIWDHKEHLELSELLIEKKRNRFSYKIKQLMHSKVEKIVFGDLLKDGDVEAFVKEALDDGKFKIYDLIHSKFENIKFEITKSS